MGNLFSEDSTIGRFGTKVWELMVLNFLTVLCMLPIVTAGAALSAMHYTLLRLYRGEMIHVTTDFFHAFRRDFRQATLLWILYLVLGLLLGFDYFFVIRRGLISSRFFVLGFYIGAFLVLFSATWVFILLSRYNQPCIALIKSSFVIGAAYIIYTITMVTLNVLPIFLLINYPRITPIALALGLTGPGYICSILYSRVFEKMEGLIGKAQKED